MAKKKAKETKVERVRPFFHLDETCDNSYTLHLNGACLEFMIGADNHNEFGGDDFTADEKAAIHRMVEVLNKHWRTDA
jgi:hypothetical protein